MSRSASTTLIGAFVIGALALAVFAVIVLGSGKFFTKRPVYVMFFEGSVKGLNVGSPVNFRGVKIGSVKDIELKFDAKDLVFLIPVYVELDPTKVTGIKGTIGGGEHLGELVQKGLRAQLELQSILTGQLMINVDFFPDKPARYVGMETGYPEIPTVPSPLDELLRTAQELPLKELFDRLLKSIEGIERIANSPQVASSIKSLSEGLEDARKILGKIDSEIGPLMANLKNTSDSIRTIAVKAENVPASLEKTMVSVQDVLKQTEKTLSSLQGVVSENSDLYLQVGNALEEITRTSRSIRSLGDYLYRHPESVVKGKKSMKGE